MKALITYLILFVVFPVTYISYNFLVHDKFSFFGFVAGNVFFIFLGYLAIDTYKNENRKLFWLSVAVVLVGVMFLYLGFKFMFIDFVPISNENKTGKVLLGALIYNFIYQVAGRPGVVLLNFGCAYLCYIGAVKLFSKLKTLTRSST